jgi:hypothetical protein
VKRGGITGKLGMLARGAQLERLRQRRQIGVVDMDCGLRQGGCISNVDEGADVTNI